MIDKNLNYYVKKHKINECFDYDMTPYMSLHYYKKGEDLLIAGNEMKYFYFIVEGKVKIFNTLENGKSVLLRFGQPLSDLGSLELLNEDRTIHSCVQSLHGTYVIIIPFDEIEKYVLDDVTFLKYIIRKLGHKLSTLSNAASINMTYPFKNRFASYLISITDESDNKRVGEIKMTKLTELSTFLGTSYRHLNRVIKELEDEKIIKRTDNSFLIMNYEKLKELSGGFYE